MWTSEDIDETEARTLTSVDDRILGLGVTEMNDSWGTRWCVDGAIDDGGDLDGALGTGGSAGGVGAVVVLVLVLDMIVLDDGGNLSSNDSSDGIGSAKLLDNDADCVELDLLVPFLLSSS